MSDHDASPPVDQDSSHAPKRRRLHGACDACKKKKGRDLCPIWNRADPCPVKCSCFSVRATVPDIVQAIVQNNLITFAQTASLAGRHAHTTPRRILRSVSRCQCALSRLHLDYWHRKRTRSRRTSPAHGSTSSHSLQLHSTARRSSRTTREDSWLGMSLGFVMDTYKTFPSCNPPTSTRTQKAHRQIPLHQILRIPTIPFTRSSKQRIHLRLALTSPVASAPQRTTHQKRRI